MNVHPATVCVALEHFATYLFCLLSLEALLAKNQNLSGYIKTFSHKNNLRGKNVLAVLIKPLVDSCKLARLDSFCWLLSSSRAVCVPAGAFSADKDRPLLASRLESLPGHRS